MKCYQFIFLAAILLVFTSYTEIHKYYISNTQVDYIKEQKTLQIITRVFVDDVEAVLKERYDVFVSIAHDSVTSADIYLKEYLKEKLQIKINNKPKALNYVGKALDGNILKCYLEINNLKRISTFEISNEVLFDIYDDQQNITKLDINQIRKSYLFSKQKSKATLTF